MRLRIEATRERSVGRWPSVKTCPTVPMRVTNHLHCNFGNEFNQHCCFLWFRKQKNRAVSPFAPTEVVVKTIEPHALEVVSEEFQSA